MDCAKKENNFNEENSEVRGGYECKTVKLYDIL